MQTALAVPDLMLVGRRASAPASVMIVRRAEWIIFVFLLYAAALTFFLPAPEGIRARPASLNLPVVLAYAALIFLDSGNRVRCSRCYAIGYRSE
jgi:hypothetical protein